jgi:hypothetical protein
MDIVKEEFPEILENIEERRELFKEFKKVHAERSIRTLKNSTIDKINYVVD